MKAAIVFLLLLVTSALVLAKKVLRARGRLDRLRQLGRVRAWEEVEKCPESLGKVVQTDFGFGREVWAVPEQYQVDLELRGFKAGILIAPRPKPSDVQRFCEARGIGFAEVLVK